MYLIMRRGQSFDRMVFHLRLCQPSTLRMVICPEAIKAQNNIAAVFRRGQHGLGLDPPFELFVQSLNRIRCADRFPLAFREAREGEEFVARFSSRLSATARHFTRHLQMNALRLTSISGFEAA